MSSKSKSKKSRFNFREILSNIRVTEHFEDQVKMRFDMSVEDLDFSRLKIANIAVKHSVLRNKIITAKPNIMFAFSEYLNIIVPIDMQTSTAITALYLDGRDGYNI